MLNRIFKGKEIIHKALDGAWVKNNAISQNIANVNTPGYKRITVEFQNHLHDAINKQTFKGYKTHEKHILINNSDSSDSYIDIKKNNHISTRKDDNGVNIDVEMAELSKNTILYNTLISRASFRKVKMILDKNK